jgi:uncharacterized protein
MLYLDTSVLVPLFVPEPQTASIRQWAAAHAAEALIISDWTLVEFASAVGMKVRQKTLKPAQAQQACRLMNQLAEDSLQVVVPTRAAYSRAAEFLGNPVLGLRAGDALHLAVAIDEGAGNVYTLDQKLIVAGRKLKLGIEIASPI